MQLSTHNSKLYMHSICNSNEWPSNTVLFMKAMHLLVCHVIMRQQQNHSHHSILWPKATLVSGLLHNLISYFSYVVDTSQSQ